jgi:hypothetical protein
MLDNVWVDRRILELFLKAGFLVLELNIKYGMKIKYPPGSFISPAFAG